MNCVLYYKMTLTGEIPHLMCPLSLICNDVLLLSRFLHVVFEDDELEEEVASYLQGDDDWDYKIEPVWVYIKGSDHNE